MSSGITAALKSAALHGLHASGMARLAAPVLRVRGAILALHEIQDDPDSELQTGCSTVFLEKCIRWVRANGWEALTLDAAVARLGEERPGNPFVVFTFDDGYRDNVTRALPILHREQIPFIMYVPTGAITRELFAWWLGLREVFRKNDKVEIAALNTSFSCPDLQTKLDGLATVTRWGHRNYHRIFELRETFVQYGISLQSLCDRYFISRQELQALATDPLATIGAHSVRHLALATLDASEVARELVDNRQQLENDLDRKVDHFAYPYGNSVACGAREAQLAISAGFRTAVNTRLRPLFARDHRALHALPRICIQPHSTVASLNVGFSGLTPASVGRIWSAAFR